MRQVAIYGLTVMVTLVVMVLLWQFREAVFLFLLSLSVAAAMQPLIYSFTNRGLPQQVSLGISYLLLIGVLVGLIVIISEPLVGDLQNLTNDFMVGYEEISYVWPRNGTQFQQSLAAQLPNPDDLVAAFSSGPGQEALRGMLGVATSFFATLAKLGIVLVLSLYWSTDRVRFERLLLSLVPVKRRAQARDLWRDIETGVGSYIRSEFVQALLAGVLLWVGYRAMGLQYPVLLALVGALAWLIPWLGALLAVVPPFLVGLGISLPFGLLAAVYTLIVLFVLEFLVEPRLFPRQEYSSLLLVLVFAAMAYTFGLAGLLLAPPLVAAIQIFFRHVLNRETAPNLPPREEIALLESRLDGVYSRLAEQKEAYNPEVQSLLKRLDDLLEQTGEYLATNRSS